MKPLLLLLALAQTDPGSAASRPAAPATRPTGDGYHRQVLVHLVNGEKVKGLVRAGTTPEKPGGVLGFIKAKPEEEAAGIRLWYVFGTNSYIFLPLELVKRIETVATLSDLEVKELDKKMEEDAARSKAEQDARLSALRALQEQQAADHELIASLQNLARLEEEALAAKEQVAKMRELLAKFPPEKGWVPEKLIQIRTRIVNDVFPSPEEREFVKVYEDWKKAYEAAQSGALGPAASRPAREEAPASKPAPRE